MPREFSFEELHFDPTLGEEGVWFRFPDAASDFQIRIAHHDRPAYDREVARARRHFSREILIDAAKQETEDEESAGVGGLDPELDRKITARALSRAIVKDWKLDDKEMGHVARMPGGEVLDFSPDNAEKLLCQFTRLYQFVVNRTYQASHFRAAAEESDQKN